jgi:hypothetical protein
MYTCYAFSRSKCPSDRRRLELSERVHPRKGNSNQSPARECSAPLQAFFFCLHSPFPNNPQAHVVYGVHIQAFAQRSSLPCSSWKVELQAIINNTHRADAHRPPPPPRWPPTYSLHALSLTRFKCVALFLPRFGL